MLSEKAAKIYRETGADALYTTTDYLRRYLTGFYSTDGYVIVDAEKCVLVVDPRYFEAAENALKGSGVEAVEGTQARAMQLLSAYRTLGVPFPLISHSDYLDLEEKGFRLKDSYKAFIAAMKVKSEEELACIRKSCDIAEEAFLALLPQIKEGMTEREVAAVLEYEMRKRGADGTSFDTICAFGANGSVPHHETGNTR